MQPPATDSELLDAFVRERSHVAFAELSQRFGDLVRASAQRQVRDPHLAEDVAQAVFIVLARRAQSIRAEYLSGWLLKTTHFCAAAALRGGLRRRYYEHEAAAMRPITTSAIDGAEAAEVVANVDAAMAQLDERTRTAVVLRYLQNRPLREVALTMGLTADAAQKVIARALPKLRTLLERRGVALGSTTVLTTHLTRMPASPGPAAVSTSAQIASIAKGAMQVMMYSKLKLASALAATILLAGTGGLTLLNLTQVNAAPPTAPAAVAPVSAPQEKNLVDFNSPFLELVGCRIKQRLNLQFNSRSNDAPLEWTAQQYPEVRWSTDGLDPAKVASYTLTIDEAGKASPSSMTKLDKDATSIPTGPNEPGEYTVTLAALDANGQPIAHASAKVIVKPLELVQIMINDLQPDDSIRFTNVMQHIHSGTTPAQMGGFRNSDFVNVEAMTDDAGKPLKFSTDHQGSMFTYRYQLNQPVEPGKPLMTSSSGTMTSLIRSDGEMHTYQMDHNPGGNSDTRRIELFRLPERAELIETTPADLPHEVVDGRVQIFVDVMIPQGGSNQVAVQYRLAEK